MRYKLKKDEFHGQISQELHSMGFSVLDLSRVGGGCPDLLVSKHGVTSLVELKTPLGRKTALERRSGGQIDFHNAWKGPIITAFNSAQISYEFNMLLKRREAWAIA